MEHNALLQWLLPFTLFNIGYIYYNCYETNAIRVLVQSQNLCLEDNLSDRLWILQLSFYVILIYYIKDFMCKKYSNAHGISLHIIYILFSVLNTAPYIIKHNPICLISSTRFPLTFHCMTVWNVQVITWSRVFWE